MYIWILRYKDRRHKSMIDRIGIYFSKKCHESLMKTVYEHTYLILHVHLFLNCNIFFVILKTPTVVLVIAMSFTRYISKRFF